MNVCSCCRGPFDDKVDIGGAEHEEEEAIVDDGVDWRASSLHCQGRW